MIEFSKVELFVLYTAMAENFTREAIYKMDKEEALKHHQETQPMQQWLEKNEALLQEDTDTAYSNLMHKIAKEFKDE